MPPHPNWPSLPPYQEANPAFGDYNITFMSPIESTPGGMVFYVQAVNLENGSTYTNPNYNTIRLILDGNSPLVISATPSDGEERHVGSAGAGQPLSIVVQDTVDPPNQINLHYWVGCLPRVKYVFMSCKTDAKATPVVINAGPSAKPE